MRITITVLAMAASLFPLFPVLGQDDWRDRFYSDRELFESGGGIAGGGICMHVTSVVGNVPLLWDSEPNYWTLIGYEILVEILSEEQENRIVQAANMALEGYGFVRVDEDVYELPGSSLCFLKMYRSESPRLITFIPFFQNPLDRCFVVFEARYDPIEFERTLIEEFAQLGLTRHTKMNPSTYLFHPPPRAVIDKCELGSGR